jgi:hypothetical protein
MNPTRRSRKIYAARGLPHHSSVLPSADGFPTMHDTMKPKRLLAFSIAAAFALILTVPTAPGAQKVFNVLQYGAVGNGATLDTAAIQKAIDAAAAEGNGARVLIPKGHRFTWLANWSSAPIARITKATASSPRLTPKTSPLAARANSWARRWRS